MAELLSSFVMAEQSASEVVGALGFPGKSRGLESTNDRNAEGVGAAAGGGASGGAAAGGGAFELDPCSGPQLAAALADRLPGLVGRHRVLSIVRGGGGSSANPAFRL